MAALSLALPFSAVLYLLPSVPNLSSNLGKVATTVNEQANDIGIIDVPKEIRKNNGRIELERSYVNGGSLYPLGIIKPIIGSLNDATRLNVGFQAKVESKKHSDHAGISTNIELAKQSQWSHDDLPLNEHKKLSTEEERIKSLTRAFKNGKDANILHLYVPDITDALATEKSAKANTQLGSDVVSKDTDEKNNADNRVKKKNNYIRLCRSIDESTASLIQKLRGKDCVKLPKSEFYLEQDTKDTNRKESTIRMTGLKIGTKINNEKDHKDSTSESDEYKQENGTTESSIAEASIADDSINYEELIPKINKLGMGLNIKKPMIDRKIGKLALSTTIY
ncbi:uncharacterized protein LOC126858327 [Cataglyphis hispanica]|uniref:uncharacterized protein LOC126858327 n=1 Tax=Cataglyphis hispanica TaxID=1086592 RepID=UPI0021801B11|nr:uncharacterized protein LOC126858327 [Cataglyphis hispanica]